jgi:maleylpyruvate isomerase
MKLHGYFRSSAAWRLRIALALKGIAVEQDFWHLRRGEQRSAAYLAINPTGLVPALDTGAGVLTQSLAILEYLDETVPEPPLLPRGAMARARVRALALTIACDIHPMQNPRIQSFIPASTAPTRPAVWPGARIGTKSGSTRWNSLCSATARQACSAMVTARHRPISVCFRNSEVPADSASK